MPFQSEDGAYLGIGGAETAEGLYVLPLVYHEHRERADDVEASHQQDEGEEEVGNELLDAHHTEDIVLLLVAVGCLIDYTAVGYGRNRIRRHINGLISKRLVLRHCYDARRVGLTVGPADEVVAHIGRDGNCYLRVVVILTCAGDSGIRAIDGQGEAVDRAGCRVRSIGGNGNGVALCAVVRPRNEMVVFIRCHAERYHGAVVILATAGCRSVGSGNGKRMAVDSEDGIISCIGSYVHRESGSARYVLAVLLPFDEVVMVIGCSGERNACGAIVVGTAACYRSVRRGCGEGMLVNGEERLVGGYRSGGEIERCAAFDVRIVELPLNEVVMLFGLCGQRHGSTFIIFAAAGYTTPLGVVHLRDNQSGTCIGFLELGGEGHIF